MPWKQFLFEAGLTLLLHGEATGGPITVTEDPASHHWDEKGLGLLPVRRLKGVTFGLLLEVGSVYPLSTGHQNSLQAPLRSQPGHN